MATGRRKKPGPTENAGEDLAKGAGRPLPQDPGLSPKYPSAGREIEPLEPPESELDRVFREQGAQMLDQLTQRLHELSPTLKRYTITSFTAVENAIHRYDDIPDQLTHFLRDKYPSLRAYTIVAYAVVVDPYGPTSSTGCYRCCRGVCKWYDLCQCPP